MQNASHAVPHGAEARGIPRADPREWRDVA
jgi:hypothetical protein